MALKTDKENWHQLH